MNKYEQEAIDAGATHYSPAPLRAVKGVSFTYEQLELFASSILSTANAAIAMKDEALVRFGKHERNCLVITECGPCDCGYEEALSTSPESLAAWEAEKLLPLQRQVAVLVDLLIEIYQYDQDGVFSGRILDELADTQATAEAYDREHGAKVLEEFLKALRKELKCNTKI